MKIKLSKIIEINNLLGQIIDNNTLNIDPLFKFRLLGIMKSFEIPIDNFETIKNEKIREYGTIKTDNNGNKAFHIDKNDEENFNKFTNDIEKIINADVDINMQKLKACEVFNKGLPAEYMIYLYDLIEG